MRYTCGAKRNSVSIRDFDGEFESPGSVERSADAFTPMSGPYAANADCSRAAAARASCHASRVAGFASSAAATSSARCHTRETPRTNSADAVTEASCPASSSASLSDCTAASIPRAIIRACSSSDARSISPRCATSEFGSSLSRAVLLVVAASHATFRSIFASMSLRLASHNCERDEHALSAHAASTAATPGVTRATELRRSNECHDDEDLRISIEEISAVTSN